MLELGAGADILRSLGWLYIGLIVVLVVAALRLPKRWWQKLIGVIAVLLVFIGPAYMRNRERSQIVDEGKVRYQVAKELFDERCKTAGEKIYKIVENVEGVLLLNVRPDDKAVNRGNPNWPDAALPDERGGRSYIASFLMWEQHQDKRNPRGYLNYNPSDLPGYRYVDVKESDEKIYRYALREPGNPDSTELSKSELQGPPARYAVSFVNMVDSADRAHWVAGTTVTITDTQLSSTVAQSTWYSFEPGLGSTAGHRSPWGFAVTCPRLKWVAASTRMFVDQVLKPRQGE